MRKNNVWMIMIMPVIIMSCLSTSTISIQVLEPARFNISPSIQKVSMVDHSNLVRGNYYLQIRQGEEIKKKPGFDSLLSKAFMAGLSDILYNSPRFMFNDKYNYKRDKTYKNRYNLLEWDKVKEYCDKDTSDALISLEFFTLNDSSSKNVTYQPETGGYYGSLKIVSYAAWRIYYPYSNNKYTDFNVRDTMKWDNSSYSSADIALAIPDREWALEQASYKAGQKFGGIIAQQWKSVDRFIYDKGNMDLRYAAELVTANKWNDAISNWKTSYEEEESGKPKAAYAYNIAVGYEVMDNIDEAMNWAAKSYELNPSPETKKYITTLEHRKSKIKKIEEQMNEDKE